MPPVGTLSSNKIANWFIAPLQPVSPACAVLMFHPFDFEKELGDKQGKVLVVREETVFIHNIAIAGAAVRQVLSSTDDFRMAKAALRHAKGKTDEEREEVLQNKAPTRNRSGGYRRS